MVSGLGCTGKPLLPFARAGTNISWELGKNVHGISERQGIKKCLDSNISAGLSGEVLHAEGSIDFGGEKRRDLFVI